jgi:anthranilate phosphoribosyltransferase
VAFVPTAVAVRPAGKRLLDVRRVVGLRNPAHSLVKLMNPWTAQPGRGQLHPSRIRGVDGRTFELTGANALLLRGTEGEPVADPRRTPQMDAFRRACGCLLQEAQTRHLPACPSCPPAIDAASTAAYMRDILVGRLPVPAPIETQVEHILRETGSS